MKVEREDPRARGDRCSSTRLDKSWSEVAKLPEQMQLTRGARIHAVGREGPASAR